MHDLIDLLKMVAEVLIAVASVLAAKRSGRVEVKADQLGTKADALKTKLDANPDDTVEAIAKANGKLSGVLSRAMKDSLIGKLPHEV